MQDRDKEGSYKMCVDYGKLHSYYQKRPIASTANADNKFTAEKKQIFNFPKLHRIPITALLRNCAKLKYLRNAIPFGQ